MAAVEIDKGVFQGGNCALLREVETFRFGFGLANSLNWPGEMREAMINRAFVGMVKGLGPDLVFERRNLLGVEAWTLNVGNDGGYEVHCDSSGNFRKLGPINSVPDRQGWQSIHRDVAWGLWGHMIPGAVEDRIGRLYSPYARMRELLRDDNDFQTAADGRAPFTVRLRRTSSGAITLIIDDVFKQRGEQWRVGPDGVVGFECHDGYSVSPFSGLYHYSFGSLGEKDVRGSQGITQKFEKVFQAFEKIAGVGQVASSS